MAGNNLLEDEHMSAYVPATQPREHHEYPKWKHHADGSSRIVNDEDEEAALGTGWHDFKHQASEPREAADEVEDELDTLIAKAQSLNIAIDKRWGLKRLREAIEQAQA